MNCFYQKSFQKTRAYIQHIYHFSFFFFLFFVNDIIIVWALIMLIIEFAFWYHLSFKIYDDDFNVSGIRSFFFLASLKSNKAFHGNEFELH